MHLYNINSSISIDRTSQGKSHAATKWLYVAVATESSSLLPTCGYHLRRAPKKGYHARTNKSFYRAMKGFILKIKILYVDIYIYIIDNIYVYIFMLYIKYFKLVVGGMPYTDPSS